MNLKVWKDALKDANLLPELNHVLEGFASGFDQGIPAHTLGDLRWYTPDNYSSAEDAKTKIQKSITEEVDASRMFGPFSHEDVAKHFSFFRTNPLGSVVNADGKMRPINDLSHPKSDDMVRSVNSFVNKHDFSTTWDDFKVVSTYLRNLAFPCKLALFDWAKAYRQIPTHPSQWPYLLVKDLEGNLFLDTRITFGGVAGCGSFGIPADAWKKIMESEFNVVKIFRWVDDNLFIKKIDSTSSMEEVTKRSVSLGVATSTDKCREFEDEQKFIGFIWNGRHKTVRLTAKKLEERKLQIKTFLIPGLLFKFNDAEVLAGRLTHVSLLLPQLRCYTRSIYRWMNQWKKRWATRMIPTDVGDDLSFWLETLDQFTETRLCPLITPTEIGWVGDASTSFGIGVLIGNRWGQLRLKETWKDAEPNRTIAWLETVAIRIGIAMLSELNIEVKGKNLVVYTDNTTTESVLNTRKSRDYHANQEWKEIQRTLLAMELDLTPRRVISVNNVADGLLRGVQAPHLAVDRVWFNIPKDLQKFMFHA
jgi:uncharacterized protein YozE (UPF0346 family)